MTVYALVINNTIEAVQGRFPRGADADGQWIEPVTEENAASCGWFPVVDVARPADTDTTTHDRSVELVNGAPTVVWSPRPWTPDELAARTASANGDTIRTQAVTALNTNRTFLAIASPTNAQTLAQVKALTRQNNGLIRLTLNALDGID